MPLFGKKKAPQPTGPVKFREKKSAQYSIGDPDASENFSVVGADDPEFKAVYNAFLVFYCELVKELAAYNRNPKKNNMAMDWAYGLMTSPSLVANFRFKEVTGARTEFDASEDHYYPDRFCFEDRFGVRFPDPLTAAKDVEFLSEFVFPTLASFDLEDPDVVRSVIANTMRPEEEKVKVIDQLDKRTELWHWGSECNILESFVWEDANGYEKEEWRMLNTAWALYNAFSGGPTPFIYRKGVTIDMHEPLWMWNPNPRSAQNLSKIAHKLKPGETVLTDISGKDIWATPVHLYLARSFENPNKIIVSKNVNFFTSDYDDLSRYSSNDEFIVFDVDSSIERYQKVLTDVVSFRSANDGECRFMDGDGRPIRPNYDDIKSYHYRNVKMTLGEVKEMEIELGLRKETAAFEIAGEKYEMPYRITDRYIVPPSMSLGPKETEFFIDHVRHAMPTSILEKFKVGFKRSGTSVDEEEDS